jgi:hypothetical protein
MLRSATISSLLLLSIAGTAAAEEPPAPPAPADTVAVAPVTAPAAEVPAVVAAEAAPTIDAFGLPCEVTFSPRAARSAKGGKKGKAAKVTKSARGKAVPAPAGFATGVQGRGGEFALDRIDRGGTKPSGEAEVRMQAATVTPAMVGIVVREHAAELELCMTKLPRESGAATVSLVLKIEANGTASSVQVTGLAKATAFNTCLAAVARTWAYPHADAAVQIEYPITLNDR